VTIKLDPRAVTRAALRAFQEKDLTNPTPREYTLVCAVVHALCEALEAATDLATCGATLNEKYRPLRRCTLAPGHTCACCDHLGEWPRAVVYDEDRADVDASPKLVAELIRKAKAGEGRRTVAAVVHHYEALIARALAELVGIDHSACEAAADILRGER
jgi:hypothetical protein